MKQPLTTVREGGTLHWVIRLVTAVVIVAIVLYIPTRASNGLVDSLRRSR